MAKVRALELKSLSMTNQEVSVGVKWENFLASMLNRDLVRSPELKALIRSGVPHEHRSRVWQWCVSFHVKKFRDNLAPDYYETLLNVARDKPNPASKQIELDLLRTLPNNKHYSSPSAGGIQKLRNVLMAFSWRNPDIGYCQGLNRYRKIGASVPFGVSLCVCIIVFLLNVSPRRLAAIALLYLDQEDAFWSLVAIVEVFMPRDYYTKTLLGSQVSRQSLQPFTSPIFNTNKLFTFANRVTFNVRNAPAGHIFTANDSFQGFNLFWLHVLASCRDQIRCVCVCVVSAGRSACVQGPDEREATAPPRPL